MNIASKLPETPCYVIDLGLLKRNLKILADVREHTGARVIMALKGFAMFSLFPLIREYLTGMAASSLHEARLAREEFGAGVHVYAPAYRPSEFGEILKYADHIVFNSFTEWRRFRPVVVSSGRAVGAGLRINPEHSEVKVPLYDACRPLSRLGITRGKFDGEDLDGITGLHFHTLCELGSDALERTLAAVEEKFGDILKKMEWVNFGGGHHITRPGYDIARLYRIIKGFRERYGADVYLEPGEAIALNTGFLVATVLDIVHNGTDIAILDTSAAAHMPDVIEMPYRPEIVGAGRAGEFPYTYQLGGATCLAGDIIGEYSFKTPLKAGNRLTFLDMAHYTMVKNNTFNGVNLPSIATYDPDKDKVDIVRTFGYEDYKNRLS